MPIILSDCIWGGSQNRTWDIDSLKYCLKSILFPAYVVSMLLQLTKSGAARATWCVSFLDSYTWSTWLDLPFVWYQEQVSISGTMMAIQHLVGLYTRVTLRLRRFCEMQVTSWAFKQQIAPRFMEVGFTESFSSVFLMLHWFSHRSDGGLIILFVH